MLGKLMPILLALFGIGLGVGGGIMLRPAQSTEEVACAPPTDPEKITLAEGPVALDHDYIKLSNQFVIPVVKSARVKALVVMSISLEVGSGQTEAIYQREPKLRDALLRVMFDHANLGGFDGTFTENGNLAPLRASLLNAAKRVIGSDVVSDVLIIDIVRQDS